MNTLHLEYIIEIYKSGSLNKAAKNCFISQSYLSKIIRALEDELGYKLVQSSNRGVVFTDEGLLFVKSAEIIVQECNNILKIPQAIQRDQRLIITCSPSSILMQSFIDFKNEFQTENINDTLIESGIQQIFKNMTSHTSEIGLVVMFSRKVEKYRHYCECYNLEMDTLLDGIPNVAIMSTKHSLAAQTSIELADLRQYPFVLDANVEHDDTLGVLNIKDAKELLFVSGRGCVFDALRSNQYITAMMPISLADAQLNQLVSCQIRDLEEKMSIMLLKLKSHNFSKRESEFIDFLRKRLRSYYRESTKNLLSVPSKVS